MQVVWHQCYTFLVLQEGFLKNQEQNSIFIIIIIKNMYSFYFSLLMGWGTFNILNLFTCIVNLFKGGLFPLTDGSDGARKVSSRT